MTPILASYGWPVFDVDGRIVAIFAIEDEARAWALPRKGHTVGIEMVRFTMREAA